MTGRNFVLDPRVKGVSQHRLRAPGAARAWSTRRCSRRCGCRASPRSRAAALTKIVPEADAKQQGMPVTVGGGVGAGGDRLVTAVYVLKYESAAQLVNVLRPLITPEQRDRRGADRQRAGDHRLCRQPEAHRPDHRIARRAAGRRADRRPAALRLRARHRADAARACSPTPGTAPAPRPTRSSGSRWSPIRARTACWCAPRTPRGSRACAR